MTTTVPLFRGVTIVGGNFRPPEAQRVLATCPLGTAVTIKPVTDNPHDPLAAEAWIDGQHVGFIPRTVSAVMHVTEGLRAKVVSRAKGYTAIDVDMDM